MERRHVETGWKVARLRRSTLPRLQLSHDNIRKEQQLHPPRTLNCGIETCCAHVWRRRRTRLVSCGEREVGLGTAWAAKWADIYVRRMLVLFQNNTHRREIASARLRAFGNCRPHREQPSVCPCVYSSVLWRASTPSFFPSSMDRCHVGTANIPCFWGVLYICGRS